MKALCRRLFLSDFHVIITAWERERDDSAGLIKIPTASEKVSDMKKLLFAVIAMSLLSVSGYAQKYGYVYSEKDLQGDTRIRTGSRKREQICQTGAGACEIAIRRGAENL